MKNLYEIMESMNKDEKMWACLRVELNDLRKISRNQKRTTLQEVVPFILFCFLFFIITKFKHWIHHACTCKYTK